MAGALAALAGEAARSGPGLAGPGAKGEGSASPPLGIAVASAGRNLAAPKEVSAKVAACPGRLPALLPRSLRGGSAVASRRDG